MCGVDFTLTSNPCVSVQNVQNTKNETVLSFIHLSHSLGKADLLHLRVFILIWIIRIRAYCCRISKFLNEVGRIDICRASRIYLFSQSRLLFSVYDNTMYAFYLSFYL